MQERIIQTELLELLDPGDVRARRSRRDLRVINRTMGNNLWWRRIFSREISRKMRTLEIGAGDGGMLGNCRGRAIDALELAPRPAHWPARSRWHQQDVRRFTGWAQYDAFIGNLVFHHFRDSLIALLGERIRSSARIIAACEPLRAQRFHGALAVLCRLIAANEITRHDGNVSIDAGFRGDELPRLLGLDRNEWRWSVHETWTGAYRLIARRRGA